MAPPAVAKQKLNELGLDIFCERVADGESINSIARELGISGSRVFDWVNEDSERSARVIDARRRSAYKFDDLALLALEGIDDDATQAAVTRQREIASHMRWRAKLVNPREFGDKVTQEVVGDASRPVLVGIEAFQGLSRDEIAQLKAITDKALGTALINGTTGEVIDE